MPEDSFVKFVADQLRDLRNLEMKRMFGGHGLYLDGVFFGILSDGKLYFKTNEKTVSRYAAEGSAPFTYERKAKAVALKHYYEVPVNILEDSRSLKQWALEAAQ